MLFRSATIEKELAAIAGQSMSICFDVPGDVRSSGFSLQNDHTKACTPNADHAAAVPSGAASKTSRLERNEVLNDPVVKMVLLGLNATPINIEKMEQEAPDTEHEEPVE